MVRGLIEDAGEGAGRHCRGEVVPCEFLEGEGDAALGFGDGGG